ncbi:peptidase U32 family protein [Clostridium cylindrosporum]|uniref:Collagenase-like protease n=1 Tax=Clostridium cylindrosporum DSM 605 TaxID=1121307 RepID=A0A0J8DAI0_CLOCY|nr:U32 family peptidase [Clostridium cylindrosporum]KMT21313.1 collagenase-like protease [Clostridium cylindrosporum DSM 605]
MSKIELLAPAGNLEKLKTAIIYGADAVYIGGELFSLRAKADNFDPETMKEAVEFAHSRGKKIYVTVNIFAHNSDIDAMPQYIKTLEEVGIDAVIVSDLGIFSVVKEVAPNLEVHVSTQANNTNYKTAEFWHKLGAQRIVLARELSMAEIKEMRAKMPKDMEIEAFVHGAMCMSYSGRCLLSNYMTGRDANRGACSHACRYKYHLMEEKRPGQYFEITEDERGTYILNSHDLCMIEHIPDLIESGIMSFKIEGRMKSSYYVASVIKAYRMAIDAYLENKEEYKYNPKWMEEVSRSSHRAFSTGFYYGKPDKQILDTVTYERSHEIMGLVVGYDKETKIATIEQRNKICKGEEVEILSPKNDNFSLVLDTIWNENGEEIESAPHPQMIFKIKCEKELKPFDMIVKEKAE